LRRPVESARHEMRIGELGLGAGLMALVFYSSRHDYDR
jgi:hypothetical protein